MYFVWRSFIHLSKSVILDLSGGSTLTQFSWLAKNMLLVGDGVLCGTAVCEGVLLQQLKWVVKFGWVVSYVVHSL